MKLFLAFSQYYRIICLLISFVVVISYFIFINNRNHKHIIVLASSPSPTKIKPHGKSDNIIFKNENSIYDKIKPTIDYNIVKLRPDPEEPIFLQNKNLNDNIVKNFIDAENIITPSKNFDITTTLDTMHDDDMISPIIMDFESGALNIAEANARNISSVPLAKDDMSDKDDGKLKIVRIEDNHQNKYIDLDSNKNDNNYWKIQLGIFKAESDAYLEWEKIKQKNESIFIDCEVIVRKSKHITEKVFYILLAGNYSSMGKARAICRKLRLQNQHCIVSR